MIKASLLRQSAQKYATGNIKKGDYLLYRNDLLDAIDYGDPLPEIPDEWLRYKGSSTNPELQTLMTKLHALDEKDSESKTDNKTLIIIIAAVIMVLIAVAAWFFVVGDNTQTIAKSTVSSQNSNNNPFLKNSRKLIPKDRWLAAEVILVTKQWNKLSTMEQTALKRNVVVQQLKTTAISKQNDASTKANLKAAIQKLLKVL